MRYLIRFSLRLQFLIIILGAVLLVFGTSQLRQMPVDVYPEFNPPLVEVQTEALGLSATEMEALITVPMEADLLNGVAWLDQIYSESVSGLSSILLVFEPDTDPIAARQMVQERLTQSFALPNVSKPPTMLQPLSATSRVMMIGLSGDDLSLIDMGVLARWNIKPRLMGVPGVANVAIWGQRERQLQVQVDPKRLSSYGVTLSQIIKTTGEALWFSPLSYLESSSPGTAGWIDTPNQRLSIRHELPISSPNDLAQVSVVGKPGLLLGDLAEVVEDHQPLIGDAILESGPGLLLVIEKFPGANTLEVTRGVEEALWAMQPGLTGINIDTTLFRPANYIELAISNLSMVAVISALFLIVVLGISFWHWRAALISFISILLSLITAGLVLYLSRVTFNAMTLAGLTMALAVIVDDAIVDVDIILQRLRQMRKEGSGKLRASTVLSAALETRSPLTFATLIILLTLLPVLLIQGLTGKFFQPVAISYLLAVVSSMVVSLIVTPALSLTFLIPKGQALLTPGTLKQRVSPLFAWLQTGYEKLITAALRSPRLVYTGAGIIFFVSIAIIPLLTFSLIPSFKQTDILIEWEAVPGTSRGEMNRITQLTSNELRSLEGVKSVGTHVGRAITGDAVVGINSAELWVSLDPSYDYEASLTSIREVINGYPGFFREVSIYQPERIGEVLMEKDEDIVVRLYGHDLGILQNLAQEVKEVLLETKGVVNARGELPIEEPQLEIEVDLTKAERYRIKPGDVRRSATTLLSGIQVGNLYEDQKVFDVIVWGIPEIRSSLTDIESLLIDTPSGQVPLDQLAKVQIVPAPSIIKRDIVSRFIDVEADISGVDLASVTSDIEDRLQKVEFPLEYHAEVLGKSNQKTSQLPMLGIAITIVAGIYLLMQATLGSWRLAFFSFLTLPLSLSGVMLATFINGHTFSLGSLLGLLSIFGIGVRNVILLINHFQNLQKLEGVKLGQKLITQGVKERMVPIVTTASALGLVFLPLVIAGDIAGLEIIHPMAIAILGGLFTSTLVNLFVVPAFYFKFRVNQH